VSEFLFFELKASVRQQLKLPPQPVPVRRERQQTVFLPGGQVDLAAMLEEVCLFLRESPARTGEYQPLVAALAYLAGTGAAGRGLHEQAIGIYKMGLSVVPDSVALRSHHALALQSLGRSAEARDEIEALRANAPQGTLMPVLWMILARIYADEGEYLKSYRLLKEVSATLPEEDGFWNFLGEMAQKAGIER